MLRDGTVRETEVFEEGFMTMRVRVSRDLLRKWVLDETKRNNEKKNFA